MIENRASNLLTREVKNINPQAAAESPNHKKSIIVSMPKIGLLELCQRYQSLIFNGVRVNLVFLVNFGAQRKFVQMHITAEESEAFGSRPIRAAEKVIP